MKPTPIRAILVTVVATLLTGLVLALPAQASVHSQSAPVPLATAAIPADASQVVTVHAAPGSSYGELSAWDYGPTRTWSRVLGPVQVRLGSRGIGTASEGSAFTPAGTFSLTESFGRQANPGTAMPYFRTDGYDWWNGNVNSPAYNSHVRQASSPGGASENLYGAGAVYDYAVNIGYNLPPATPGAGSAFFVHVTNGAATAGCVALPRTEMIGLLTWLNPNRAPVIQITTGTPWTPPAAPLRDGDFIEQGGRVHRMAGGAPIYVHDWNAVGGSQPYRSVSAAEFAALRRAPADGTFVVEGGTGRVHQFVGGAPLYVNSWAEVGGQRPATLVPALAITQAGSSHWTNLRRQPADGTTVMQGLTGRIHVFAGGAPVYVDSWSDLGGGRPATQIAGPAITQAGTGNWSSIRRTPADGTFLVQANSRVSLMAGGAPVYVDTWGPFGGPRPVVRVSTSAITAAGQGSWSALAAVPAPGTYVRGVGTAHIYQAGTGGRLRHISYAEWTRTGGGPIKDVAPNAITQAGSANWPNLSLVP